MKNAVCYLTCGFYIFLTGHENQNIPRGESKVNGEDLGSDTEQNDGVV